MSGKFSTVRLALNGEHFEILVKPEPALDFKLGKGIQISQVLAVDEVYTEASKGLRSSSEKLTKLFGTDDPLTVAESILKKGELQLTTDQRRKMVEEKRKQIISNISRNYVNPKTKLPHPPLRVEQGIKQARVTIDPFQETAEQTKTVVDALRTILPLKSETVRLQIRVPPQFASQAIGVIKGYAEIQNEIWGSDGFFTATVDIPAGVQESFLNRLGSVTKGSAQAVVAR